MKEDTEEHKRLYGFLQKGAYYSTDLADHRSPWKKWGPFVSERAWGTVREDYSANGDAWSYLTHDMSRSKAYRWGEDGLAAISDLFQTVVFSLALWNGKDPILKERLFGLSPYEGNHGEDVKECYYYLDATPTHSYLKFLYKYPQRAFPYDELVEENKKRGTNDREYELYDTKAFEENRYFDVFVEYAKASEDDICIKIQVFNRGPSAASIHVLPQVVFRNTWSWSETLSNIPSIKVAEEEKELSSLYIDPTGQKAPDNIAFDYHVAPFYLYGTTPQELLFTNNETHNERIWGDEIKSRTPYVKDAFHRYVIQKENCINPKREGTKAAFHYGPIEIAPGGSYTLLLRMSINKIKNPLKEVESILSLRKKEADQFYDAIQNKKLSQEDKKIQRTAYAGMIWSKQLYLYDVRLWLTGDNPSLRPPLGRGEIRNGRWKHLYSTDIFSMPDKWEYPWFAAWDLAFHTLALGLVDRLFAKRQLLLLLTHMFQHPNGQIPAYEWSFSDLNPPVQAWALWKLYKQEERVTGKNDREFLLLCFLKLMHNFDWWVNKVDRLGNNFFEGGFLGLDNISVIDRSQPLKDGGMIEQSDATGWMGFYALMLMRISLELAKKEPVYEGLATMFYEEFASICHTIHKTNQMWDEEDGFFYDIILYPNGDVKKLKIRSFVGVIPFYSLFSFEENELKGFSRFFQRFQDYAKHNKPRVEQSVMIIEKNGKKQYLFSLMNENQIQKVLSCVFDPNEFLSDYGLRSLSKVHEKSPLVFEKSIVSYEPGESLEKIKGGNSNWRGPVWIPTNMLFLNALEKLAYCHGDEYIIAMRDGSNKTLKELVSLLKNRLANLFRKDATGRRPVHGEYLPYQKDPHWNDLVLFYEHYHGDTGRGLGASHQTGWSGLIANVIESL